MKVENQVSTLEQSLRLKELGVEQNGIFIWWCTERLGNKSWSLNPPDLIIKDEVSSFTVAELGIMIGSANTISYTDNEATHRANDLIHLLEVGELLAESVNERLNFD